MEGTEGKHLIETGRLPQWRPAVLPPNSEINLTTANKGFTFPVKAVNNV